jgi:hypothetical protein
MNKNTIHTALTIFTLGVMMLSSTGFTTIVGYCSMTKSTECCCEGANEKPAQSTDGLVFSDPAASCYAQTLAGGRNEMNATMHSAESVPQPSLEIFAFESDAACLTLPAQISTLLTTDDVAPPGIDIYIRVNSFLI